MDPPRPEEAAFPRGLRRDDGRDLGAGVGPAAVGQAAQRAPHRAGAQLDFGRSEMFLKLRKNFPLEIFSDYFVSEPPQVLLFPHYFYKIFRKY